jgi:16S rRNA (uracil1498-N3)-methyltransferase
VEKDSDILFVTNGSGYLFETEITPVGKCTAVISFEKTSFKISFHLAVAPTK